VTFSQTFDMRKWRKTTKTILAVLGDVYHPAAMAEKALREALKLAGNAALRLADAERLGEEPAALPDALRWWCSKWTGREREETERNAAG